MSKSIAMIGLGLIGGSMALALKGFEDYEIIGVDVSQSTLRFAAEHGVAHRVTEDALQAVQQADVTILCLHPRGIVDFLNHYRADFKAGSLVIDVCGIKTAIMQAAQVLPPQVDFIGCHPMAGIESSGIQHADGALFQQAHFIITPQAQSTQEHLALLDRMAHHMGCRDVVNTTPEDHDALIAYTSQMMHIIAVSVCDDPGLFSCRGFEGSSFRGCTRVAALDVPLWTQLFSMNSPALLTALRQLEGNLHTYVEALEQGDTSALSEKLAYSAARKRKMDLE